MIALAEEADEEYGRRLREGIQEASKMKDMAMAETAEEMHPLGAKDAGKAVKDAIDKGRDAEPY
jgi:catalase